MTGDRVGLSVPAKGEYAKVVRMTAAAIATRMGMSYDDVEDVRMAVEEAFIYAVDGMGEAEEVPVTFLTQDDTLRITVGVGFDVGGSDEENERRASLAQFILDSVCDHYEFDSDADGARWLRMAKTVKAGDGE